MPPRLQAIIKGVTEERQGALGRDGGMEDGGVEGWREGEKDALAQAANESHESQFGL